MYLLFLPRLALNPNSSGIPEMYLNITIPDMYLIITIPEMYLNITIPDMYLIITTLNVHEHHYTWHVTDHYYTWHVPEHHYTWHVPDHHYTWHVPEHHYIKCTWTSLYLKCTWSSPPDMHINTILKWYLALILLWSSLMSILIEKLMAFRQGRYWWRNGNNYYTIYSKHREQTQLCWLTYIHIDTTSILKVLIWDTLHGTMYMLFKTNLNWVN